MNVLSRSCYGFQTKGQALPSPLNWWKRKSGIQNGSRNLSWLLRSGLSPWHPAAKNLSLPGLSTSRRSIPVKTDWQAIASKTLRANNTLSSSLHLKDPEKGSDSVWLTQEACGSHWSKPLGPWPLPSTVHALPLTCPPSLLVEDTDFGNSQELPAPVNSSSLCFSAPKP